MNRDYYKSDSYGRDQVMSKTAHPQQGTIAAGVDHLFETNEQLANLPQYLKQFVVDQNYPAYSPVDHAVWRYVMRRNFDYLKDHAHSIYTEGLSQTGIGIDCIPSIEGMNEILSRIGWAAVCVDGFIPPAVFMAFQAHRVLVIAADIRQIEHIEYTPSPDIIHEAAGHAPVIADPEYAEYLRYCGEVGSRAIASRKDIELYEAIRHLSILKEAPNSNPNEIKEAEKDVLYKQSHLGPPSEMALLSRLHWWTVEYGLVGTLENPKIYGAGLLSSIGEASDCLSDKVKKLPYNLQTADYVFDITTQQPQLFVAPDFAALTDVLQEFAGSLAFSIGGQVGVQKAIECERVASCQYNTGVQVSGKFVETIFDSTNLPGLIRTTGPTALAMSECELPGQSQRHYSNGYAAPVGRLKDSQIPLERMTDSELALFEIEIGQPVELLFESGICVSGSLNRIDRRDGEIVLLHFIDYRMTYRRAELFAFRSEIFAMAVGENIASVFSGAADKDNFESISIVPHERVIKTNYDNHDRCRHTLYARMREMRDNSITGEMLNDLWNDVRAQLPNEWLLPLEILELLDERKLLPDLMTEITTFLEQRASDEPTLTNVINNGIDLINRTIIEKEKR